MWQKKIPEALNDANLRKAAALARAYGLTIIPLRLYRRKNTRSILFFREGSILVKDEKKEGEDELSPPRAVTVPGKTIVMNSLSGRQDDGELDIYHECTQLSDESEAKQSDQPEQLPMEIVDQETGEVIKV